MEVAVIRHDDELQHHGIKGQRWGQRRFQNPDGSLTERGKKRYNKEVEKLKAEEKKIKEAEKVAATKKKTQAKLDKLDAKKAELEERKKALKKGGKEEKPDENAGETPEQKKARLMSSTNPKEIYENRDLFTYQELNDRVNRIDLEARLSNKIPAEPTKKGALDYVDSTKTAIDKVTGLYKSVDSAYSAVTNSAIGKTVAKQLGLDLPKEEKEFNLKDFYKNINKKSNQELQDAANRIRNQEAIEEAVNKSSKKSLNTDAVDYDDFYNNIDKYDDKTVQRVAQRAENQAKIKSNKDKLKTKEEDK